MKIGACERRSVIQAVMKTMMEYEIKNLIKEDEDDDGGSRWRPPTVNRGSEQMDLEEERGEDI